MSLTATGQKDDARQSLARAIEVGIGETEEAEARAALEGLSEERD